MVSVRKPIKAIIMDGFKPEEYREFQFNPTPIERSVINNFEPIQAPGINTPSFQYTGGEAEIYNITIYLDDKGEELGYTSEFLDFMERFTSKGNAQFSPPSPVIISYGTNFLLNGLVMDINIHEDRFDPETLMVTRAEIGLTINISPKRGSDSWVYDKSRARWTRN